MSYSEYITIYLKDDSELRHNREKLWDVKKVCENIHTPCLNDGYWEEEDDIFEYITKKLMNYNDKEGIMFEYCNHDGINDEEVHKCHFLYCKVLNILFGEVVELKSQHIDDRFMWDEDNNRYECIEPKNDEYYQILGIYEEIKGLKSKSNKLEKEKILNSDKDINDILLNRLMYFATVANEILKKDGELCAFCHSNETNKEGVVIHEQDCIIEQIKNG